MRTENKEINLKVGDWYLLDYGLEVVSGKCVDVNHNGGIFMFRWGGPIRSGHCVNFASIKGKINDPRLLSRFIVFIYQMLNKS